MLDSCLEPLKTISVLKCLPKNFFGPTIFWLKIFYCSKQSFGQKKNVAPKFFLMFVKKKILVRNNFWAEKNFGSKNFWSEIVFVWNNFCPEKSLVWKKFGLKKKIGPKKGMVLKKTDVWEKNFVLKKEIYFLSKEMFGLKFFFLTDKYFCLKKVLTRNFFWPEKN